MKLALHCIACLLLQYRSLGRNKIWCEFAIWILMHKFGERCLEFCKTDFETDNFIYSVGHISRIWSCDAHNTGDRRRTASSTRTRKKGAQLTTRATNFQNLRRDDNTCTSMTTQVAVRCYKCVQSQYQVLVPGTNDRRTTNNEKRNETFKNPIGTIAGPLYRTS